MITKIRNIALLSMAGIILILSITLGLAYYFRNDIIELFVGKINQRINTPVETRQIHLDLWSDFPYLSLQLDDVKIHESKEMGKDYLCKADQISVSFNILNLLFNNYTVRSIDFKNAGIRLAVDPEGIRNFDIFQGVNQAPDVPGTDSLPEITIQNIGFEDSHIEYIDIGQNIHVSVYSELLDNHLGLKGNEVLVSMKGKAVLDTLLISETSYLQGRQFDFNTDFTFNTISNLFRFTDSSILMNGHQYLLNGTIETMGNKNIDIHLSSLKNNFQSLISLLPDQYRRPLSKYKSKGKVDFNGSITGPVKGDNRPEITVFFSCEGVEFFYPGYKKSFHDLSFQGKFNNGSQRNVFSSFMELKNFSGFIDGQKIAGNLSIHDFKNLNTSLDLEGSVDFRSLLETFPVKTIETGDGNIHFNLELQGSFRNLRNDDSGNMRASGGIELQDVFFISTYTVLPFRDLNGRLVFNNMDLGIQDLTGMLGESKFNISGFFKNIIPYILFKDRPISIEADIKSDYLNLNQLFTLDFTSENPEGDKESGRYHLGISPRLNIDFNCDVKKADLKRFHGENIKGRLRIKDQIAIVENASMNTMGGDLFLSGSIVSRHPQNREFLIDGQLKSIYIDSVFYVFNNFKQQFLIDRNLKGQIDASVNTYFTMNDNLEFFPGTLSAFIGTRIKQGQLMDFKPIQSLSKYLKNEDLSNVRFSDLQNNIQIFDRKVIIPEMEIISSAYAITVYGTHTFDQDITYHFKVPLDQFRGSDRDERFGRIENEGSGPPNLFLKMHGNASDYKVTYDTKTVTEKIKKDLKEEGREIKEVFRKKRDDDKKQAELEEDEYFDF